VKRGDGYGVMSVSFVLIFSSNVVRHEIYSNEMTLHWKGAV